MGTSPQLAGVCGWSGQGLGVAAALAYSKQAAEPGCREYDVAVRQPYRSIRLGRVGEGDRHSAGERNSSECTISEEANRTTIGGEERCGRTFGGCERTVLELIQPSNIQPAHRVAPCPGDNRAVGRQRERMTAIVEGGAGHGIDRHPDHGRDRPRYVGVLPESGDRQQRAQRGDSPRNELPPDRRRNPLVAKCGTGNYRCAWMRGRGCHCDRRNETVASPVDRLDVGGRLRIVAQRLAQNTDGFGERRIGDERILPDRLNEDLLRNNLTRFGDEQIQDRKHSRRKRELPVAVIQQPVAAIVNEWAERNRAGAGATCFDLSG